ncbi:hypothetical protein BH10PSE12_BH10PSE12_03940 [soil metagenome]
MPRLILDQDWSCNGVTPVTCATRWQAEAAIFPYIKGFYNCRRRHSYLGGISSLAFEAKVA